VSQVVGRVLLSLVRLVVASLIVRNLGSARFGEYTLVLGFVLVFEWLVDFGQTDIAVRDISRDPETRRLEVGALTLLKAVQAAPVSLLLPLLLFLMGYPPPLVEAGAVGGIGLLCYAAVLIYRATFKVRMRMERDILAELAGALVILPLTWWACVRGADVVVLIGCYAVSRVVYLGLAIALSDGERLRPAASRVVAMAAVRLARYALPLGLSGLVVWLYDAMAPVLLSKIADMTAVGLYSAPARYVFAIITVVQALNTAFFPVLARYWRKDAARLSALQQVVLELSMIIGIGFICAAVASATFLMALIGPAVVDAAPVLQLMCAILLVRTVSTTMSPLIIIAGRQAATMWITVGSIGLQVLFIALLVPRYGALGAVLGYLLTELITVVPICIIGQRDGGARLRWGTPALLTACGSGALFATWLTPAWGDWLGGAICPMMFVALAFATRAVSAPKLKQVLAELAQRNVG
jgi:O-antigen/teichoic acid export membrane protein